MRQIKTFIRVVPPLLIAMDGAAFLFAIYGQSWAKDALYFHREMFGHSITLIAYMTYFSYRFKVCAYTWASLATLFLLNILNIIYFFVDLNYYSIYAGIIIFSGLTMTTFYAISTNRSPTARRKL